MIEKQKRIWEIDALRGIAIIMMVFYHILWALNFSGLINFPQVNTGFWRAFAYTTATIFIFLVGVSLTLSYSRVKNKRTGVVGKYLHRGFRIIAYGIIITLVTLLFYKEAFVYFGILHFIGTAIILAIPFLNYRKLNLALGIVLVAVGLFVYNTIIHSPYFVLLGFRYYGMRTLDYFPLLPWFGVVLLGIFFGNTFYPDGKPKFKIPELPLGNVLSFLGKHSLLIYFLHAIVIFTAIFIIKQFWL